MQLEIDCYEWVIGKIEVNKIPFDRLERVIKATINDLEKRKDKAMIFVIFAIKNDRMVII
jgi:hypothetical protein